MANTPESSSKRSEGRRHIGSYVQKGGINPDPKSRIKERPAPPEFIWPQPELSLRKQTETKGSSGSENDGSTPVSSGREKP